VIQRKPGTYFRVTSDRRPPKRPDDGFDVTDDDFDVIVETGNSAVIVRETGSADVVIIEKGQPVVPKRHWYMDSGPTEYFVGSALELAEVAQIINGEFVYDAEVVGVDTFEGKKITLTADIDLSGFSGGRGWVPAGNGGWHEVPGEDVEMTHTLHRFNMATGLPVVPSANTLINAPNDVWVGWQYMLQFRDDGKVSLYVAWWNAELEQPEFFEVDVLEYSADSGRLRIPDVGFDWPYRLEDGSIVITHGWMPGEPSWVHSAFRGTFDGAGHTIHGLTMHEDGGHDWWDAGYGLFGVGHDCTIKNLIMAGVDIKFDGRHNTGGIIGLADGGSMVVTDCRVSGRIDTVSSNIGGIIGYAYSENTVVTNCRVDITITGGRGVGGIIGQSESENTAVTNCRVNFDAVGYVERRVGGIIGNSLHGDRVTVTDCQVNIHADFSQDTELGGIVGNVEANTFELTNCHVDGSINATTRSGGLGGVVLGYDITISHCSFSGDIVAITGYVGGLFGEIYAGLGIVQSCLVTCNHTFHNLDISYVGGIAGWVHGDDITITDCAVDWSINTDAGGWDIGGIVGRIATSGTERILRCYVIGAVNGQVRLGGIIGANSNPASTISDCVAAVNVSADSFFDGSGGVAGVYRGTITRCYSIGSVHGYSSRSYLGGIVGVSEGGTVTDCAALNPSVSATIHEFRPTRRIGHKGVQDVSVFNTNVAFAGMAGTHNTDKGPGGEDGADITAAEVMADPTIGGRFTPENGWTVEHGKLPGLFGKPVDMPGHITLT